MKLNETRVFGPPGCGKTTYISKQITLAAEQFGPETILVASFTRAAAKELISRDQPISNDQIGTLHAHCYRLLGKPELAEVKAKEFNEEYPQYAITPSGNMKLDDGLAGAEAGDAGEHGGGGNELLAQLSVYRARMVNAALWTPGVVDFARAWDDFKAKTGYLDFQDLIERAATEYYPPNHATIGVFDEVQDFTPAQLSLIRKWAKQMHWIMLAGDDDQASAPWSKILTTGGEWISAEKIDPAAHRLATFVQDRSQMAGISRAGRGFIKEKSRYIGFMHEVCAGGFSTEVTHNHPSLFRFTEDATDKTCVYLMKRGLSFRVGWCQLIRADGCVHLSIRSKLEDADCAWILGVYESRGEASIMESYVAAEFGISTAVWRPVHDQSGGHYSRKNIDRLFEMLGDHTERAERCLSFFGRDLYHPFYVKGSKTKYGSVNYLTATCNLIPEVMSVPVYCGEKSPKWIPIKQIEKRWYDGYVYSFSVEKDHTYVTDNIVTHNCLYSFTGSTAEAFLNPPIPQEYKRILTQSYRVPEKVVALANRIIKKVSVREAKEYRPRAEAGKIYSSTATWKQPRELLPTIKGFLGQDKSVMILASCSYLMAPMIRELRDAGIPFSNVYKATRGDWNPIRAKQTGEQSGAFGKLCAFMEPGGPEFKGHRLWTPQQLVSWLEVLQSKGNLKKGAKKASKAFLAQKSGRAEDILAFMLSVMEPDAFDNAASLNKQWFVDNLSASKTSAFQFPSRIYDHYGNEGPSVAKSLTVGTIHSVKGAEADVVIVFPDLSLRGAQQYSMRAGEGFDQIIRQFYVAVTRTRHTLILCRGAANGMFFNDY